MIQTINPYKAETIKEYQLHSKEEIVELLKTSTNTYESWKNESVGYRTAVLKKVSELLWDRKKHYAELITIEMGKPITQSLAEIDKCIWACDFYAQNAAQFLADELIPTDADESFVSYDPMGTILAIMPWNYPFWQVIRFAAPNLTAGNTAILKHASNTSGCALALEQLFLDAGYPQGCFQTLLVDHSALEDIIANDTIQGVTLTGSENAGRTVAALAGKYLKKSVMELGGNNACIVWEDANLDAHIQTMVQARMQNTGQSCIAAKRFIVVDKIYDKFMTLFKREIQGLKSGDPMDIDTEIGVMAREDLAAALEKQVNDSVHKGAKLSHGTRGKGTYFEPMILENVLPGMPAFEEELFGPVAVIIRAKDRKDAIALATTSKFGLGSMLFTKDIEAARRIISSIPDGAFFVNEMVKSDPRLPFGGTKASGYGRELSKEGMLEFVNRKTVYINQ